MNRLLSQLECINIVVLVQSLSLESGPEERLVPEHILFLFPPLLLFLFQESPVSALFLDVQHSLQQVVQSLFRFEAIHLEHPLTLFHLFPVEICQFVYVLCHYSIFAIIRPDDVFSLLYEECLYL